MMSLVFVLEAASGPTGPRAIRIKGLGRTKRRWRQSRQRPSRDSRAAAAAVPTARGTYDIGGVAGSTGGLAHGRCR
jgi:hypothetical protein